MRRRRGSRISTSSELSTNSDQSENLNLVEELPDPGLPKPNSKDVKEKKRVSFNFPVEVITKDGKFTGMGTIDLTETSTPSDVSSRTVKTKGGVHKEIIYDMTQNDKKQYSPNNKDPPKNQDRAKTQKPPVVKEPAKVKEPAEVKAAVKEPVEVKEPATVKEPAAVKEPHKQPDALNHQQKQPKKRGSVKPPQNKQGATKKITIKEAREAKRREVDVIKKAVEAEKQAKKEFEQIEKVFKPEECLKYMNIEIHPDLAAAWFIKDMIREAKAAGVKVVEAEDICDPGLLMWTRFVPPAFVNDGGQVKLTATKKQCDRAFYIITAEEVATLISEDRFREHMALKHELIGCKLTLIIFGASLMFLNLSRGNANPKINQEKFGRAIGDLQMELMVEKKIDLIVVDNPKELGLLITHYTRAIAEAPYQKAKRDIKDQAAFYMEGDNKNCVIIDKYGNGLSRLWEQMIAVLPKSSLEVARAIGAEYKTPSALLQEFENSDGIAKVAGIGVTRSNVPGAKTRKLGPEFARRLHTLFTCEDGNTVIE